MLDRARVREALGARNDGGLTLVAAPAGYGKTTAVRGWLASQDAAFAWVTLDAADNDPVRLWRYVATALDRVRSGLGRRALQRLSVTGSSIEDAVDELLNGAAAFEDRLVIVLDDVHAVTDTECRRSLDHAISHLPVNVSLILISRADPALALARLRVAGRLLEFRAAELAFTPAEAYDLLVTGAGIDLGKEEIGVLVEHTEGWPAALVLAGHWLSTVDDPARAVREFGGEHLFVAEYLSGEVLASLDEERRSFLLSVAVLGEFTAELCDAVLGRTDSAEALAELERANLFVLRLERGGWYRVHSLFAEYARSQLAVEQPTAAASINRLAAEWLRERGLSVEAVAHASAAGDDELLAELLVEYAIPMIRHGMGRTLLHWVGTLPDDVLVVYPEIAGSGALATIVVGGHALDRGRYLKIVDDVREAGDAATPLLGAQALIAHALALDEGVARAVEDGRKAVELAHEGGVDEATSGALSAYARALYFAGDLDEAWAVGVRMLEEPSGRQRTPSVMHTHATLALVDVDRGRLASARAHAAKARTAAGSIRTSRSWLGANACAAVGAVAAAEDRLVDAEHELARAVHLFTDEVPTLHHTWALVLLAGVRLRRGRLDDAEAALRTAQDALARLPDSGRVRSMADELERDLAAATARARGGEVLEPPSEAELAVLKLLATDLSTREIAERLFLSANTIRSHRRALYHKLGVHARAAAVARATTLGLLDEVESPG